MESKSTCSHTSSMPSLSAMACISLGSMPTMSLPSRDSKGGKSGLVATTSCFFSLPVLVSVSVSVFLLPQAAMVSSMAAAKNRLRNLVKYFISISPFLSCMLFV